MRAIAMYLPQFHRVKENDEWWGDGFTEWVTVRGAKPLYEGHGQPKVPLNGYYYDLMDKSSMEWQAGLMRRYGIDGICMYHYWFSDGRRILEKPAENLLKWRDLNMPFCFCWANQTWARSWSNIKDKNVWADTLEKERQKDERGILLEQDYGYEDQWKEHFAYLLPFFRDSRYVTIDGKPVFVIYRTSEIHCLKEMLELWRSMAVESGLGGLYIIGIGIEESQRKMVDAVLLHAPAGFTLEREKRNELQCSSYDLVWEQILKAGGDGKTFFGGFVSYDDTPRRGKKGWLIEGDSPTKFTHYLTELMAKNEAYGSDMVFLNAWNEWGEGMYLEPDILHRYGYLEAISHAKEEYKDRVGYYREFRKTDNDRKEQVKDIITQKSKSEYYLKLLDAWMALRKQNICLDTWMLQRGYRKIGIYGYGLLGKHLVDELDGSGVEILFIIDRDAQNVNDIPFLLSTDTIPEADVIIVSAMFYYDEIYNSLIRKGVKNIVSLEWIIFNCGNLS